MAEGDQHADTDEYAAANGCKNGLKLLKHDQVIELVRKERDAGHGNQGVGCKPPTQCTNRQQIERQVHHKEYLPEADRRDRADTECQAGSTARQQTRQFHHVNAHTDEHSGTNQCKNVFEQGVLRWTGFIGHAEGGTLVDL